MAKKSLQFYVPEELYIEFNEIYIDGDFVSKAAFVETLLKTYKNRDNSDQKAEIIQLNIDIEAKDQDIDRLNGDVIQLNTQIETLENQPPAQDPPPQPAPTPAPQPGPDTLVLDGITPFERFAINTVAEKEKQTPKELLVNTTFVDMFNLGKNITIERPTNWEQIRAEFQDSQSG